MSAQQGYSAAVTMKLPSQEWHTFVVLISLTLACLAAEMQHATNGKPPCFRAAG